MPSAASSLARVLDQLPTAARTVLLTPNPCKGTFTLVLMMFTIRPYPLARMPGTTAWARRWLLIKCCWKAATKASGWASKMGPAAGPPVLLTKMCTVLPAAKKAFAAAATWSGWA